MAAILGFNKIDIQIKITTNNEVKIIDREELDIQYLPGDKVVAGINGAVYPEVPVTSVTFEGVAATDEDDFYSKLNILMGGSSGSSAPKTITVATYTLEATDVNNIYTQACTVTVPAGLSLAHSSFHTCTAVGDIEFVADDVVINNYADHNASNGQYAVATLFQTEQDVYILAGNTKAV